MYVFPLDPTWIFTFIARKHDDFIMRYTFRITVIL